MPGSLSSRPLNIFIRKNSIRPISSHETIIKIYRLMVTFLFFVTITGCFHIHRRFSPSLSDVIQTENLISMMRDQGKMVSTFSASGTIIVDGWIRVSTAEILIAGIREPFRVKMEITHSWGKPIIHILIRGDLLEILEFNEKRLYTGEYSSKSLSKFLPGGYYNPDKVWSILRGFPNVLPYQNIQLPGPCRIDLLDRQGQIIEEIDYHPEKLSLKEVSLPGRAPDISFSEFMESNGIYYAAEVKLENIKGGKHLILRKKRMTFNREIPDQIFNIEKPNAFETVFLDESN
jgi:hypothetical protein